MPSTPQLPVSVSDAKNYLRRFGVDELGTDTDILLEAAAEWCEDASGRALRLTKSHIDYLACWSTTHRPLRQPLKAITSVDYFDIDGNPQNVAASNYRIAQSNTGPASIEFDNDFSFPATDGRANGIAIAYDTGYASMSDIPEYSKLAILTMAAILSGDLTKAEMEASMRARDSCLALLEVIPYQ